MAVLILLAVVIFCIYLIVKSSSNDTYTPGRQATSHSGTTADKQSPQYTTTLRLDSHLLSGSYCSSAVHCKDGTVYTPSGSIIGYYEQASDGKWYFFAAYSDEKVKIGLLSSDYIYFDLYDDVDRLARTPQERTQLLSRAAKTTWFPAEVVDCVKIIEDKDSGKCIGHYEGSPIEAAAAFACWAYKSGGNKYGAFFRQFLR